MTNDPLTLSEVLEIRDRVRRQLAMMDAPEGSQERVQPETILRLCETVLRQAGGIQPS